MTEQEKIRRKKIIKQLNKFGFEDTLNCCVDVNDVVNWHLAEIDMIVEPLYKVESELLHNQADDKNYYVAKIERKKAINETLKRAKGQ